MSDIQEQIKIAHRKALEQDFDEIIKELKQEEHKNLELSMRINKAIEYINNIDNMLTINVDGQGRIFIDEEGQNDLLNILQCKE